jgi:hypothetical protein
MSTTKSQTVQTTQQEKMSIEQMAAEVKESYPFCDETFCWWINEFNFFQENVQKYIPNISTKELYERWSKIGVKSCSQHCQHSIDCGECGGDGLCLNCESYGENGPNGNMCPNWKNGYLLSCLLSNEFAIIPESLNVSGCAIALFGDGDQVMIGDENRKALTDEEQKEIGSAQPYTLPENTIDYNGNVIDNVTLGRMVYQRQYKLKVMEEIPEKQALDITRQCISDGKRFKDRNFKMVGFRERKKRPKKVEVDGVEIIQEEHPRKTFDRLLEEEFGRKFIGEEVPEPFLYSPPGRSSQMLVYPVDIKLTNIDNNLLAKKGKSNYFCAKDIPKICNNDYYETRNQRMVHVAEAYRILIEFGEKYKECDLSRWGAIHMFETIIKVKYGKDYLDSLKITIKKSIVKDNSSSV